MGNGNRLRWKKMGLPTWQTPLKAVWNMRPDSIKSIKKRIERRGTPEMRKKIWSLWWGRWTMKIHIGLGRLDIHKQS